MGARCDEMLPFGQEFVPVRCLMIPALTGLA